jgi:hypothetical protein
MKLNEWKELNGLHGLKEGGTHEACACWPVREAR